MENVIIMLHFNSTPGQTSWLVRFYFLLVSLVFICIKVLGITVHLQFNCSVHQSLLSFLTERYSADSEAAPHSAFQAFRDFIIRLRVGMENLSECVEFNGWEQVPLQKQEVAN